jgi:hypothetical protein
MTVVTRLLVSGALAAELAAAGPAVDRCTLGCVGAAPDCDRGDREYGEPYCARTDQRPGQPHVPFFQPIFCLALAARRASWHVSALTVLVVPWTVQQTSLCVGWPLRTWSGFTAGHRISLLLTCAAG